MDAEEWQTVKKKPRKLTLQQLDSDIFAVLDEVKTIETEFIARINGLDNRITKLESAAPVHILPEPGEMWKLTRADGSNEYVQATIVKSDIAPKPKTVRVEIELPQQLHDRITSGRMRDGDVTTIVDCVKSQVV